MPEPHLLEGPTVRLEALSIAHLDELEAAANEDRSTFTYSSVPARAEDVRSYIDFAIEQRDAGHQVPFATRWKGHVVGSTRFHDIESRSWDPGSGRQRHGRPDTVEIGATWLSPSAQRTGCNREAKLLMLGFAFDEWQVHAVRFRTDERNHQSRRAIEGLGATFEGVLRADRPGADGTVRNSAYYSVLAAEWPSVRERLGRGPTINVRRDG